MKKLYNSPDAEIDMFELSSSILTLSGDGDGGLAGGDNESSINASGGIEDIGVIIDVVDPHDF